MLMALVASMLVGWSQPAPAAGEPAQTMKAVRMHDFGGPEVLKLEDVAKPAAGPGEVLIRVKAAGVNPVDWKLRDGMGRGMITTPFVLGFDVSGVIESVGQNVGESSGNDAPALKPGDEVFVYLPINRGGGYAQFTTAPASSIAKKPTKIDHVKAGGVPLAALTAWQALFDKAGLKPGQTVLIHAGAGGVGHFAVQLAVWKGAKVIATASAANAEFVRGLGAQRVIDYKSEKFEEIVKDADVVFDMIGGDTLERSYQCLKEGGYLVSIVAPPSPAKLAERKARGSVFLVQPSGTQLAQIAALIDEGKLKPEIDTTFELKDVAAAHERSKSGKSGRGKIVLTVP